MAIITNFEKNKANEKIEIIDRFHAERIINHLNIREVIKLAYMHWSLDLEKGVVALDLSNGRLIGYSEGNNVIKRPNSEQIVVFELDDHVDVDDVTILLGNSGVKALRSFFQIDDETFSANMNFWTEKYLSIHNMSIKDLRNQFIKVLFKDYKQAFFDSCIKNQLNRVYSFHLQNAVFFE
ncbi:hypothetical protein [Bacillus sp. EAC]|uniref:hypothetical protein n=1 Tax=Bacillus sp. EAC TaxID=1978338 RepID=UPI001C4FDF1F|nr:hypothetical protein [Bacillus sp. EAC]